MFSCILNHQKAISLYSPKSQTLRKKNPLCQIIKQWREKYPSALNCIQINKCSISMTDNSPILQGSLGMIWGEALRLTFH